MRREARYTICRYQRGEGECTTERAEEQENDADEHPRKAETQDKKK